MTRRNRWNHRRFFEMPESYFAPKLKLAIDREITFS